MTPNRKTEGAAGERSSAVSDSGLPSEDPAYRITLWPHRSLSRRGFRRLMLIAALGLAAPVAPFLGGPVGWVLAPFALAALALLWLFLKRNYRDAKLSEELTVWPGLLHLVRREASGEEKIWRANPYWVRVEIRETPTVEHYLTLSAGEDCIELGAFLTPDERLELANELRQALAKLRL